MDKIKLLNNVIFVRYLASVGLSSIANNILTLTIYWYVLYETNSIAILALTGFVQSIPILFTFVISFLVQNIGAKKMMFIGDAARAIMAILFIVNIFSFKSIAVVVMINVVNETAELIHTSATTSIIPTLVGSEEITRCVGVSNATVSVFELIGTVIGGFFYDAFGVKFLAALIFVFFACSSIIVLSIKPEKVTKDFECENKSRFSLKFILKNSMLASIIVLSLLINVVMSPFDLMITTHIKTVFNSGASAYSILDGMLMAGMIVGSLLVCIVAKKRELKKVIQILFIMLGAAILSMGISNSFIMTSMIIFFIGTTMALIDSSLDAFLLHILPDEKRDMVFAFLTALMTATVPIGTGMFSVYINFAKTSTIFCITGVVIILCTVVCSTINRKL